MLARPSEHWKPADSKAANAHGLDLETPRKGSVYLWNLHGWDAETAIVRLFDAAAKGYCWALKMLYLAGRPADEDVDIPSGRD